MDKIEKLFAITKALHEPKSITKLEREIGEEISSSSFSHMFTEGEFEFAGVAFPFLRRKVKGRKELYEFVSDANSSDILESNDCELKSTVHPVVLPLNLTEVFMLTNHLIDISKGTEDEELYRQIANKIYPQLSDYAKKKIGNKYGLSERGLVEYTKEENTLQYALKSGKTISFVLDDGTEINGKIKYGENGYEIDNGNTKILYSNIEQKITCIKSGK